MHSEFDAFLPFRPRSAARAPKGQSRTEGGCALSQPLTKEISCFFVTLRKGPAIERNLSLTGLYEARGRTALASSRYSSGGCSTCGGSAALAAASAARSASLARNSSPSVAKSPSAALWRKGRQILRTENLSDAKSCNRQAPQPATTARTTGGISLPYHSAGLVSSDIYFFFCIFCFNVSERLPLSQACFQYFKAPSASPVM